VDSHRLGWGLTHCTAADIRADLFLREWHHRKRSCTGQPVGPVISLGIVAHLVDVAVSKGQSAKHRKTRSCLPWMPRIFQVWGGEEFILNLFSLPSPNTGTFIALVGLEHLPKSSVEPLGKIEAP